MSMFQSASDVHIEGSSTFNNTRDQMNIGRDLIIHNSNNALFDLLKGHIVPDAAYNSTVLSEILAARVCGGSKFMKNKIIRKMLLSSQTLADLSITAWCTVDADN